MTRLGRRKDGGGEAANNKTAMTMFTSLMLILLTFFIMLSRDANFDDSKIGLAMDSLENAFGFLSGGAAEGAWGDIGYELEPLRLLIGPLISDERARFSFRGRLYTLSLASDYLFEAEEPASLGAEGQSLLAAVARALKEAPAFIIIEAHTDDQTPAAGNFQDNWRLSASQASAVLEFLTAKGRLDGRLLSAYGYAGYQPAALNNLALNRFRNRRINLVLDFNHASEARRILGLKRWIEIEGLPFTAHDPGERALRP